jgi:hypothetical protein
VGRHYDISNSSLYLQEKPIMRTASKSNTVLFFFSIAIFILLTNSSFGQSNPKSKGKKSLIVVSSDSQDTLLSDQSNHIFLKVEKNILPFLEVSVSQGRISKSEDKIYKVDSLKNGHVEIVIGKVVNDKYVLIEKRKFAVATSRDQRRLDKFGLKPNISLLGYTEGKIPKSVIANACKIDIDEGLVIIEFTALLDSQKGLFSHATAKNIRGEYLDSYVMNLLKRIPAGSILVLDRLKFRDRAGNIFVYPRIITFEISGD